MPNENKNDRGEVNYKFTKLNSNESNYTMDSRVCNYIPTGNYDITTDHYFTNNNKSENRHMHKNRSCSLFPPINKEQFIPGTDQFIPFMHDHIK